MTNQLQEQVVDRKDLKIQALLEKISSQAANYENALADARVEITILTSDLQQAFQALRAHEEAASVPQDEASPADDTD